MPIHLTRRAFAVGAAPLLLSPRTVLASGAPAGAAAVPGLERSRVAGAFADRLIEGGHGADPPAALRVILANASDDVAAEASNGAEAIEAHRLAEFAIRILAPRALRDAGYGDAARSAETEDELSAACHAVGLAKFNIGRRYGRIGLTSSRAADLAWGVCAHAQNAFSGARHLTTHKRDEPCVYHGCDEMVAWNAYCALIGFLEEGNASAETTAWVWTTGLEMVEHALNE